jgi:S-DNA-T family DNA segregation ATPase FtsK/SpoIIIE
MAKKVKNNKLRDERIPKLIGILCIVIAIYLFIAFTSYLFTWKTDQDLALQFSWSLLAQTGLEVANWLGRLGAIISNLFFYWGFGLPSYILVGILAFVGQKLLNDQPILPHWNSIRNWLLLLLFLSVFLEFIFSRSGFSWGGAYGDYVSKWLQDFVGSLGLVVLFLALGAASLIWTGRWQSRRFQSVEQEWNKMKDYAQSKVNFNNMGKDTKIKNTPLPLEDDIEDIDEETVEVIPPVPPTSKSINQLQFELSEKNNNKPIAPTLDTALEIEEVVKSSEPQDEPPGPAISPLAPALEKVQTSFDEEPYDPTLDLPSYESPVLALLEDYSDQKHEVNREELEAKKDQIIETLLQYKIEITSVKAVVGPTVTLFKVKPAPGVRISKIKSLEDDIALSLSALGIRIIAPIPGEGVIGIEVPNEKKEMVSLKEVLASEAFKRAKMQLPIAFGKTISNQVFVADLAKMPHLLIAGATGQGKSVGINVVLMSLLYKRHPSEVKLVLIDPKKVELYPYAKLENHFLSFLPGSPEPITTETSRVIHTLNSLCIEMDQRYDLLKKAATRNIKEYNEKFVERRLSPAKGHRYLPFIVLIIDEFADLIMTAGKEVELPIGRLAQLSRAVGIHLIIATQRPSVNIITGVIKANFPARIAFKVTSKVDSRTILDAGGADQLIGRGDMLLSVGGDMIRLQCAFVDTPEVERVIKFIADQQSYPEPYFLPEFHGDDETAQSQFSMDDLDDMFEDAAKLIVENKHGSTSMIQRRLKLGYNRAGRIMDQLEAMGIVGPSDGSKPREVLVYDMIELEKYLVSLREKRK